MALIAPLAILAAALAALFLVPPSSPILGLSHPGFAGAASGTAFVAFWVATRGLLPFIRALASMAIWAALIGVLWFGYDNRDDLVALAERGLDAFDGSGPSIGKTGEVTFRRSLDGEFVVAAEVDGNPVKFVFDTGASTVVLTAEDARKIGLDANALDFSAEVSTANGAALAAPTRLTRIAIGPIVVRNVRALVTRPGAMQDSLLGMSFLERLQSYGVERGRLTFRGVDGRPVSGRPTLPRPMARQAISRRRPREGGTRSRLRLTHAIDLERVGS